MSDHDPTRTDPFPAEEHPKHRPLEADDPMEMRAEPVNGDPLAMLDGIIEEYARMGWGSDQIRQLFSNPFFQATHGLKKLLGEPAIEQRIAATLQRCGVFRFRSERPDDNGD